MSLVAGDTIQVDASNFDANLSYTNVDSSVIYIENPSGSTVVNGSAMSNLSTGNYRYNYNTSVNSDLGIYCVEIEFTVGSTYNVERSKFELLESIRG